MIATIQSREADAQMIAQALQQYTGEIVELPSFIEPAPKRRTSWVDPESKLKRKTPRKNRKDLCAEAVAERYEAARAQRQRGLELLRKEWPELTVTGLSKQTGVPRSTILRRIASGQSLDEALKR